MKLAEALILRSDIKKRMEQIRQRLLRNAKVQQGEKPAEDPEALLVELERLAKDFERLIQQINRTNAATPFEAGLTLSDAIAARDVLVLKHSIYSDLAYSATIQQEVRTKSEVKFKSAVNVTQVREQADLMARLHRELDTKIQEMNWKTDLAQ